MSPTASEGPASPSPAPLGAAPEPEQLVRVVALDGPAGTGKSSVSRQVAQALGWRFVDTGATYRAVTLALLRRGVDLTDAAAVASAAREAHIELRTEPGNPGVLLDGQDVSFEIRSPEVTSAVSAVAAVPAVRESLICLQRKAMGTEGAVVEGRDIATVVAPHAAVKVYLDARPEVRARRRAGDAEAQAHRSNRGGAEAAVQADLTRRDSLDSQTNRLEASDGAVHLDTSDLTLDEVVAEVVALVREAGLSTGMPRAHEEAR